MIVPATRLRHLRGPVAQTLRRLSASRRGIALTEFAFSLPIMILIMGSGLELANYVITTKRISEVAVMIADNASRIGSQSVINNKPISEAEINDVFIGAELQSAGLNIPENSRIILSSLQQNSDGGQWIKWQRCFGSLARTSSYGEEDEGATGTSFEGMGEPGARVTASSGDAVMVVEIFYQYQRITPLMALPVEEMHEVAAFNVRDSRDLTQIYNIEGVTPSTCD